MRARPDAVGPANPTGAVRLYSAAKLAGYAVQAWDGEVGVVDDFILDDEAMAIRHIVVDTHRWLPGKHVLVATGWVKAIDTARDRLDVDLNRDQVKHAPSSIRHNR